jgi:hypothetical protein
MIKKYKLYNRNIANNSQVKRIAPQRKRNVIPDSILNDESLNGAISLVHTYSHSS